MLHLGMDGPNVNLKFENLLNSSAQMKSLNTTILSIGTCPLHIVHNAFRAGVNSLGFNIDSFVIDVNFFFKLSAARRADYKSMEEFTEVISHFIQKHSSTRWVTLRKICAQLLEQFKNLTGYFLNFLPKTSSFKSSIKNTERYQRIKKVLESESSVAYIAFVAYLANDFEIFLKTFQSMETRIHILYSEMSKLLTSMMSKFIKSRILVDNNKQPKSTTELLTVNPNNVKNCKPIKLIDVGEKAKSCFPEALEVSDSERIFRQDCLKAFQASVSHLISKLPWDSTILKNAVLLDPSKRKNRESLNDITNLTKEICKPLDGVLNKVFPPGLSSKEDLCDKIRNEWRVYQFESLPESAYTKDEKDPKCRSRQQPSYWEKAFELAGLPVITQSECKLDIDKLIVSLEKWMDGAGSPKFPHLTSLFKIVASLSHGNSFVYLNTIIELPRDMRSPLDVYCPRTVVSFINRQGK